MPSPFARMLKGSAQTAHNLVTQVVVSVTAAVCVAFITNAYFDKGAPAAPQPRPAAVEASLPAGPRPSEISAAAEVTVAAAVAAPVPASPAKTALAPAPLPKLEPVIIADVPAPAQAPQPTVTSHGTEILFSATANAPVIQFAPPPLQEPRTRVLGVPLPRFLPTPGGVARTVGGIKDRMVSLLPGRERRGELNNSAR